MDFLSSLPSLSALFLTWAAYPQIALLAGKLPGCPQGGWDVGRGQERGRQAPQLDRRGKTLPPPPPGKREKHREREKRGQDRCRKAKTILPAAQLCLRGRAGGPGSTLCPPGMKWGLTNKPSRPARVQPFLPLSTADPHNSPASRQHRSNVTDAERLGFTLPGPPASRQGAGRPMQGRVAFHRVLSGRATRRMVVGLDFLPHRWPPGSWPPCSLSGELLLWTALPALEISVPCPTRFLPDFLGL